MFEMKSNINKVLKKSQATLEKQSTKYTKQVSEELVQAVATFDDVYLVPVYSKSSASLSLSGDAVDRKLEEDTLLSQLIAEQEQATVDKLFKATEMILKEAFKG